MLVNIALISCGRPRLTEQALRSLAENASTVPYQLAHFEDTWRIGAGPAHNRSVGMASAQGRGTLLYISDNDVYFTPNWLDLLIVNFDVIAEPLGFKLLGGYNHPYHKPAGWEKDGKGVTFDGVDGRRIHSTYAVGSLSWLMRWETWDRYGPLAERKGINQSEDWEFCQRIRNDGFLVGHVVPPVVINCGVTGTFGDACPGDDWVRKEMPPGVYYE